MSISIFGTTRNQSSSTPAKVVGIENKVSKSGDTMHGDLNLNNHKITNLANPAAESDGVNKRFLDNALTSVIRYKEKLDIGSRLTVMGVDENDNFVVSNGTIQVSESNVFGLETISRLENTIFRIVNLPDNIESIRLDNDGLLLKGLNNPIDARDAANKQFVEDRIENVVSDINLDGRHTIKNIPNPTSPNEAVNKNYVDQKTQILDYIQTEDENVTISRNLDMKDNTVLVGRPSESNSAINKRYFKRNSYQPKYQIFRGISIIHRPTSREDIAIPIHVVQTNTDNNLFFSALPSGSHFASLRSDSFKLTNDIGFSYVEISVTGFIKVISYDDADRLDVNIIQVKQGDRGSTETRKICKTTLKPPFDCFNLNCIVFLAPDLYRIQYNYTSSNASVSMNIPEVTIKVKLYDISELSE